MTDLMTILIILMCQGLSLVLITSRYRGCSDKSSISNLFSCSAFVHITRNHILNTYAMQNNRGQSHNFRRNQFLCIIFSKIKWKVSLLTRNVCLKHSSEQFIEIVSHNPYLRINRLQGRNRTFNAESQFSFSSSKNWIGAFVSNTLFLLLLIFIASAFITLMLLTYFFVANNLIPPEVSFP